MKPIPIEDIVHTFSKHGYTLFHSEERGHIVKPELAIVTSLHYSKEPRLILGIPVVLFGADGLIDYERLVILSLKAGKGNQMGYLLDVTQSLFGEFSYPIPEEFRKAIDVLQNTLKSTQPFYDSWWDDEVYLSYCLKKREGLQKKWNLILNISYQTFRNKFQQYISHERINEGNSQTSLK